MLRDRKRGGTFVSRARRGRYKPGRLDSRKAVDPLQYSFVERQDFFRCVIFLFRQSIAHCQHVVCYASQIRCTQMNKTSEQQSCSDKKDDCKRDLSRKQRLRRAARDTLPPMERAVSCRAPSRLLPFE